MSSQPPAFIVDEVLGKLNWDSEFQWYFGDVEMKDGSRITVYIKASHNGYRDDLIAAGKRFNAVIEQDSTYRARAAGELLNTYNENWNEGAPSTEAEFVSRMSIDFIMFPKEGALEVNYDDDGMFLGHRITAYLDPELNFDWAGLNG